MKKNPTYKVNEKGEIVLPEPRSTNEIFVSDVTKGSMPNNEKDASTFSLINEASVLSSLKSIYQNIDSFSYNFSAK